MEGGGRLYMSIYEEKPETAQPKEVRPEKPTGDYESLHNQLKLLQQS